MYIFLLFITHVKLGLWMGNINNIIIKFDRLNSKDNPNMTYTTRMRPDSFGFISQLERLIPIGIFSKMKMIILLFNVNLLLFSLTLHIKSCDKGNTN